jgi:hypothetical protein
MVFWIYMDIQEKQNYFFCSNSSSKQQTVTSYLPDECWKSIFRIIIDNDSHNNKNHNLNTLSLVSKQFLSITNQSSIFIHCPPINRPQWPLQKIYQPQAPSTSKASILTNFINLIVNYSLFCLLGLHMLYL